MKGAPTPIQGSAWVWFLIVSSKWFEFEKVRSNAVQVMDGRCTLYRLEWLTASFVSYGFCAQAHFSLQQGEEGIKQQHVCKESLAATVRCLGTEDWGLYSTAPVFFDIHHAIGAEAAIRFWASALRWSSRFIGMPAWYLEVSMADTQISKSSHSLQFRKAHPCRPWLRTFVCQGLFALRCFVDLALFCTF